MIHGSILLQIILHFVRAMASGGGIGTRVLISLLQHSVTYCPRSGLHKSQKKTQFFFFLHSSHRQKCQCSVQDIPASMSNGLSPTFRCRRRNHIPSIIAAIVSMTAASIHIHPNHGQVAAKKGGAAAPWGGGKLDLPKACEHFRILKMGRNYLRLARFQE